MTIAEFVARLTRADGYREAGQLRAVGADQLEYVGPSGLLRDEDREFIRTHKAAILAWLRMPVSALPAAELELFDFAPTAFGTHPNTTVDNVTSPEPIEDYFDEEKNAQLDRAMDQWLAAVERAKAPRNNANPDVGASPKPKTCDRVDKSKARRAKPDRTGGGAGQMSLFSPSINSS